MTQLDMQNKPLPSMAASQHEEPCLFPVLNDSTAAPCDDASVLGIEPSIVKAALNFCRRTQTNVEFFMAGVWAVILGEFTDVERVHMMLGYCSLDDEKKLGKERLADMYTVWANLGGEETMRTLFSPEHWTVLPWMPTETCAHNTGILLDVTMHEPLSRGSSVVQTVPQHATPLSKVFKTCPILLVVRDAAKSCSLEIHYRGSILSHGHAQLLRSSIAHVIASALQKPSTAPREISLSDDALQQQQIRTWNANQIPHLPCSSMFKIVQQHARSHPHKQAVHAWDGCLTFHELDALSDQLAVHLTHQEVGVGELVPVCFEKSVWAIVAMLAINKTGAAFVPLEPSLPSSRLENIAMQTDARIIITSAQQARMLKDIIGKRVIVSRPMMESLCASKPRVHKCPVVQPDDPAYCLFTSGSTGQPKGCLVGHSALANVAVHSRKLRIGKESRVLQFASFSFGISLIEIWCTLTAGGTVCVPSAEDRSNRLQDVINDMQINWALMTPTTIQVLSPPQVPCLRTVAIAGEPITKAQLDIWADAVHLFQAYGLTEWAGICVVAAQACCSATATSNIGTSAGGKFWLVDPADHNRLAPIGAEAELLIEGPCLARGYLNQPDETAARFISSPPWMAAVSDDGDDDASSSPRRLYKTGDLVRYNSDGSLSYLSRKGTSVKLRGQRIELGEVEYHIVEAAGTLKKAIAEIVVPLGGDGSSVLAAFLLPQQQSSLNGDGEPKSRDADESWFVAADEQLRNTILEVISQLQKRLPSYMVPSIFIPIRRLPVTVSGKVDRRRLRESVRQHSREDLNALTMAPIDFREPACTTENVVCRLTAEILNLPPEQVGMGHSFLQLGGDSVSAIKLVQLARRHQLSLNVGDVLRHPKLADLAQTVELGAPLGSSFLTPAPFQLVSGDDGQRQQLLLFASTRCGIPTSEIEDVYPCTPTQEDLMGLSAIRAGAGVARFTYKLRKDVHLPRFKSAWNVILDENPILRTRIVQNASHGMLQVVLYPDSFEWDDDLKVAEDRPMGLGRRLLAAAMAADAQHPTTALFVVTIHHALCDRFSMQTIMRHVDQIYRNGETVTPTPSFGSFVAYCCSARDESSTRTYWESQFHRLDAEAFPAISATSSPVADRAVDFHVRLPGSVVGGHTMSTLLRMAWAIVIMHHTSCDDVIFGTTVSGRGASVADMDQMTGPTIANVPLCIRLQPDKTIEATLMQIHQQALEMMPFEQAGIHNIQQFSEEAKAGCRFQSQLVVQPPWENPVPALWSQCHADSVAPGGFSATALVLMCSLGRDRHEMDIAAQFDGRVLDAEHVRRLLRQLDAVLQEAVLNPQQRIRDLSPLGALDVRQLKTWSARETVEASESCAHHLIETQCVQQPEGPAVSSWDGQLTYEELDHHSRRLSLRLETYGVGPDQFVPICLHKSKWTVVAMLAVMKAGGAFLLLDPTHPVSRLRHVCEQVYSRVVISSEELSSLTDSLGRSVVHVELEESMSKDEGVNGFHKIQQVQPHHALYAVFTSGSTGMPKGVVIEHRSFCSSAMAHNPLHKVTRGSRVLQFASYAFDICIMETLSTLIAGGCVCVLSESERRDEFFHAAKHHQITHAFLTPSILRSLNPSRLTSLKVLTVGGEVMLPADVASLGGQHFSLVNEYGPAECSITSTANDQIQTSNNAENIGFPVGCRCWIVDPRNHERLLPIGAVGELVIEGPIVGRGYLNDPEKTAAQFVQSPVWLQKLYPDAHKPSRLYRTGDLAKHHTDGSILYVGRKDRQVKLRGQRLELSEVESHLLSCFAGARAAVAEVVVLRGQKTPSLVAFVVDQGAGPFEMEQQHLIKPPNDSFNHNVRLAENSLRSRVPAFMIPSVFLPIGEVPCTVTGKINRRVLRVAVEEMAADEVQRHRAGTTSKRTSWTPMLIKLQVIWAAALRLELDAVGADDNFFHLGGDSITAMNVVARLQDCRLHLTVATIFSHPKLADQALVISESREAPGGSVPAPFSLLGDSAQRLLQAAAEQCQVSPATIEDMYPCTPLQEGLLALTARDAAAYVGQWMYDLPELLDVSRLRLAWERTAEAHPILRTRFAQLDARNVYQVVVRGASVPWHVWDHIDGNAAANVRHGMDIGQSPFHVGIVTKNQQLGMLLTMHHAIYDANSIRQILSNVETAYHSQTDLVHCPFSPFIQYLANEAPKHEDYWRRDLSHLQVTPFPTLPSARYRPSPSSTIQHRVVLGRSRATNFTTSTKLHLAWALIQSQYHLTDDVVFGITVSGRSAPVSGIGTITGPTIATIPLRLMLDKEKSLDALLQQTQDKRVASIPHEHAGLQNIRKWGSDAKMACSFQTLLIVQQENGDDATVGPDMFTLAKSLTDWTAFSNYALVICCNVLQRSVVELQVTFDSQVVPGQQMHRIVGAFAKRLQEINTSSARPLKELGSLGQSDFEELMTRNSEVPSILDCPSIWDSIQHHCIHAPNTVAVCAWDGDFTYGEVDSLSSDLARHLISRGISQETAVSLYFEKSRWTTVAILAVIKSGGFFILFDPSNTFQTHERIARQINAQAMLVSELHDDAAAPLCDDRIVVGDSHRSWGGSVVQEAWQPPQTRHDDALCVVFTSGSTGEPKGAVIEHGSYRASADAHVQSFNLTNSSRMLQFAAYAAAASVVEILSTLMVGGCLCVLSDAQRRDGFVDAMRYLQPSHALLPPEFARSISDPDWLASLRTLVLAGDKATTADVAQWDDKVRLVNAYGSAECSAVAVVQDRMDRNTHPNNIGFGSGSICWVIDPQDTNRLVPIGAPGELLIEGPLVARGYLNDPVRTAAAFISPPPWLKVLRHGKPSRLYRTGDLVKYHTDGSLIFVGRKEEKLQRQRVELIKVEHDVQRSVPGAAEVVVELVESHGQALLFAFVLCENPDKDQKISDAPDPDPDSGQLLQAPSERFRAATLAGEAKLRESIPGYMVPAVYIPLARMPHTMTGEADRQRLLNEASILSPSQVQAYRSSKVNAKKQYLPLTKQEGTLQGLWAEVLGVLPSSIQASDNFFHLGGDSIVAMKLASLVQDVGMQLTVADVFDAPRLCDQVVRLRNLPQKDEGVHAFSLSKVEAPQQYFARLKALGLAPAQSEMVDLIPATEAQSFFTRRRTLHHFTFSLTGKVNEQRLRDSCSAVMEKHSILRTLFAVHEGQLAQVLLQKAGLPFRHLTDISDLATLQQSLWETDATGNEIFPGLPTKFFLLSDADARRHALIIRLTHAQWDGVCLSVLFNDMAKVYNGGQITPTPDFPAYLYLRAQQPREYAFSFWRQLLHGSTVTPLASSSPVSSRQMSRGTTIWKDQWISPAPESPVGITTATLIKAAWAHVLAQTTGQTDIVFGQTVNSRSLPLAHIDTIVGPCLNIIPVRVQMHPSSTIRDFLSHIQAQHTQSMRHDYLELPEIAQHCTSWPTGTEFGSIVQHQNFDMDTKLPLEGLETEFSLRASFNPVGELWFFTYPMPAKLLVQVCVSRNIVSEKRALELLDKLCMTIQAFATSPDRRLSDVA